MFSKSYFDYKKNRAEFRQFTVNSFANKQQKIVLKGYLKSL